MLLFVCVCIRFLSQSQTFTQGDVAVNVGTGLAIYSTYVYEKGKTNYQYDTAGAYIFPIKVEYGLLNWLGATFRFNYSNYIEGDSTNTQDINGVDFGLQANFHFIRTQRWDLYAGGIASWTRLHYKENTLQNSEVKGNGTVFGMELASRFYFGETRKFGMYLSYCYVGNYYRDLLGKDSFGNSTHFYLSAIGHQIGVGLTIKL